MKHSLCHKRFIAHHRVNYWQVYYANTYVCDFSEDGKEVYFKHITHPYTVKRLTQLIVLLSLVEEYFATGRLNEQQF